MKWPKNLDRYKLSGLNDRNIQTDINFLDEIIQTSSNILVNRGSCHSNEKMQGRSDVQMRKYEVGGLQIVIRKVFADKSLPSRKFRLFLSLGWLDVGSSWYTRIPINTNQHQYPVTIQPLTGQKAVRGL